MADKKNGGVMYTNSYNGTNGGSGPEDPDISGGGIYGDWKDDVMAMHLSQNGASLVESPNVRDGYGIFGGPAAGEPNPYGFSPTCEGGGKK